MTLEERNEKILVNAPLVTSVVKKIYCSPYAYYDKEDMYQVGMIGLMKAVEKFDPEKGFQFSTYAVPMIWGEIRRFIRDESQALRYSRSDIDAFSRLARSGKSLDDLTAQEIEELQLTEKNIIAIRSMNATSLDAPITDTSESTFGDITPSYMHSDFSEEFQLEMIEDIKNAVLSLLNSKDQDIIDEWYYSLALGVKPSQSYLGQKYKVSQTQICRVLSKFKRIFAKKLVEFGYQVPTYIIENEMEETHVNFNR